MHHTFLHENMRELFRAFRYDAHPMGMFISAMAFCRRCYPEAAKNVSTIPRCAKQADLRLIAKLPTIAAFCVPPLRRAVSVQLPE
jgi:citrate synthase